MKHVQNGLLGNGFSPDLRLRMTIVAIDPCGATARVGYDHYNLLATSATGR